MAIQYVQITKSGSLKVIIMYDFKVPFGAFPYYYVFYNKKNVRPRKISNDFKLHYTFLLQAIYLGEFHRF